MRDFLVHLLLVLASVAAAVAPLELIARWRVPEQGLPQYRRFLADGWGPFFRQEGDTLVGLTVHPYGSRGVRVPARKTPGRPRLLVLGESSAWILGNEIDVVIGRRGLQDRVETVNMAYGASTWEMAQRRFDEAVRIDADAIVLLFGHNLYFAHPVNVPLWPWASRSRLAALALDRLDPPRSSGEMRPEGRILVLREGLRRMARRARARGVRLILCTMPSNLRQPPGDDAAARKDYEKAQRLWSAGRWDEARRLYIRARDRDPDRQRAASEVNEAIRSVARGEGVDLLDFERLVSARGPHGVPGPELFKDNVHLNPEELRWQGARILETLRISRHLL